MQVLVAEDDKVTQLILTKLLTKAGYQVVSTDNGKSALEIIAKDTGPKILVLDWDMPNYTGIELCRIIRGKKNKNYSYIILVTGKTTSNDMIEGFRAGVDDYITKPFSSEEVLHRINAGRRLIEKENTLLNLINKHEKLMESMPSALFCTDKKDNIVEWNRSASDLFGILPNEALNTPFTRLPLKWNWEKILLAVSKSIDTTQTIFLNNIELELKNGKLYTIDLWLRGLNFNSNENNSPAVLFLLADNTEKQVLERQLLHSQKLESIGQLSAGIAHELNTPIQCISSNLEFMNKATAKLSDKENISDSEYDFIIEEVPNAISTATTAIKQMSSIIKAMNSMSHPGFNSFDQVDINSILDKSLLITHSQLSNMKKVERDYCKDLPIIEGHPSELQQVFVNLIVNSAHAIEEKNVAGEITIRTYFKDKRVNIEISDNGCGIPDKVKDKIFDPFFTTKEIGKGTGQGLSLSYNIIIRRHKGEIDCISSIGEGTKFIICLPVKINN